MREQHTLSFNIQKFPSKNNKKRSLISQLSQLIWNISENRVPSYHKAIQAQLSVDVQNMVFAHGKFHIMISWLKRVASYIKWSVTQLLQQNPTSYYESALYIPNHEIVITNESPTKFTTFSKQLASTSEKASVKPGVGKYYF